MTEPASPQQSQRPVRLVVAPEANSRLDTLMTELGPAKAALAEAEAREEEVRAGIQAELLQMYPEDRRPTKAFEVRAHPQGAYDAYSVSWVPTWRLNTKRLKADDPATYVRYAVRGGHWEIRRHK